MLVQLVAASAPYLYTDSESNYSRCYYQNGSLDYQVELRKIVVRLSKTSNSECNELPNFVMAELILGQPNISVQRKLLKDFDYKTTETIEFTDIPAQYTDPQESVLFIYSYAYIAEIPISHVYQHESQVDNCFSNDSVLAISKSQVNISLIPNGICSREFSPINLPKFEQGELVIQQNSYFFDVSDICNKYNLNREIDIIIDGNFSLPLQHAIIDSKLIFIFRNWTDIKLHHHFENNYKVVGFPTITVDGEEVSLLNQSFNLVGLFNNKFIVRVQTTDFYEEYEKVISAVHFSHFVFRFSVVNSSIQFIFQISYYQETFIKGLQFLVFDCDSEELTQQKLCFEIYNNADVSQFNFVLDILFFDLEELVSSEKIFLDKIDSCWPRTFIEKHESKLCFVHLEIKNTEACEALKNVEHEIYYTIRELWQIEQERQLFCNFTRYTTINNNEICISYNQFDFKPRLDNSSFFISLSIEDQTYYAYADQITKFYGKPEKYFMFSIYTVIFIVFVCIAIYGLIDGIRTVIHAKELNF